VHAEAERLEHAVSDELIDRMARALGDPLYDPHAIHSDRGGRDREAELVSLADAGWAPSSSCDRWARRIRPGCASSPSRG